MLYESAGVRVEADDGVATLSLDFPGNPVNVLSPSRMGEIDRGIAAAVNRPGVEMLVVRSANPAGFCGGADGEILCRLDFDAERADNALTGQRVLSRLASASFPTVAFVHGPCLGPGLELALACDYRLAVCGPESAIGFPDLARGVVPCWGGMSRLTRRIGRKQALHFLRSGQILSGREAVKLGLFDDACSSRRAKIELRTVLDHIQRSGITPRYRRWLRRRATSDVGSGSTVPPECLEELIRVAARSQAEGEAGERKWFAALAGIDEVRSRVELTTRPNPPAVAVSNIGVTGDWTAEVAELAGRAALRGTRVLVPERDRGRICLLDEYLAGQVRRGFVTPLESGDARRRVEPSPHDFDASLVFHAGENDDTVTVDGGGEFPLGFPIAESPVRLVEVGNGPLATTAAANRVIGLLTYLGYDVVTVADTPGLVVRRILYAVFDEAVRLAAEGVPIDRIDAGGASVLPPDGPLARLDRLGMPRVARTVKRLLPLTAKGLTFYRPGRRGTRVPDSEAGALLWESRFTAAVAEPECNVVCPAGNLPGDKLSREIADRLDYRAVNEAARCLHADPFITPVEIDALAADGAGVFVRAGGPLAAADSRTPAACVQALARLAARYGPRFTPCPSLVRRAAIGEYFRKSAQPSVVRPARIRAA